MAELKFKTRGMVNPQGLPRVYFSCHPADFDRYFEMISDEILKKQNCAVFYYDDLTSYDEEELFLDLGQMQLFVMPVTTNLLVKENRAIDVEFKFAMEKHIPVLPLMQESGLEELFNKKCGDLQFLDRNVRDITAISYDEKLEKYLSSVLVGDELAAKVRAAFDAYVFLSYRKKDRKYAQELMRLIHKNDFCRDIAIWYDEFLTPGENFNDSIKDALKKSELFALVVTPNLVNETNYVMTTEYPMAKEENKLILPAEIVETDKNLLKEKYDGIPDCTDAHDEPALTESLVKLLENIAIKENDSSPEHNFFIGLAYLSGIDVEVDHERAVALITSAAEAGLPEAMEKLVAMYRNGEGVARSYKTALEWNEKYVQHLKNIYENAEDGSGIKTRALSNFFYEASLLCLYYQVSYKYEEAKMLYNQILIILEENFSNVTDWKRRIAKTYDNLGSIAGTKCEFVEANEYYLKALKIKEQLAKETNISDTKRELSESYILIGDMYEKTNNFSEAKQFYFKALKVRESVAEDTYTPEVQKALYLCYDKLGNIAVAEGNFFEAKQFYLKSLQTKKQLAEDTDSVEVKCDLIESYLNMGTTEKRRDNFDEAEKHYLTATKMAEQLAENTDIKEVGTTLSTCYDHLSILYYDNEQYKQSAEYNLKSVRVEEKIVERKGSPRDREILSLRYEMLGVNAKLEGNFSEAKEYFLKALEISEQFMEETGTPEAKKTLSECYNKLGDIAKLEGNLSEAKEYFLKALEISEQLAKETDLLGVKKDLLITSYEPLGKIAKTEGKLSEAKDYYLKALEIAEQLAEEMGTPESYYDLAKLYSDIGLLDKNNRDKVFVQKAYDIYSMLSNQYPENTQYSKLSLILKALLHKMNEEN